MSVLNNINARRIINLITGVIEDFIEVNNEDRDRQLFQERVELFLDDLKTCKCIEDYSILPFPDDTFSICFKPIMVVDTINLRVVLATLPQHPEMPASLATTLGY